jgi:hypothetical protein
MEHIYAFCRIADPGQCKVGSHTGDVEKLKKRYITSIPDIKIIHFIPHPDHKRIENDFKRSYDDKRVININGNKSEWFRIHADEMKTLLSDFVGRYEIPLPIKSLTLKEAILVQPPRKIFPPITFSREGSSGPPKRECKSRDGEKGCRKMFPLDEKNFEYDRYAGSFSRICRECHNTEREKNSESKVVAYTPKPNPILSGDNRAILTSYVPEDRDDLNYLPSFDEMHDFIRKIRVS